MRKLINRVANFVRPKPRTIPAPIDAILSSQAGRSLVEGFNDFYYSTNVTDGMNWQGDELIKNPCDLWTMVELFQELRPRVLIETGTHKGASASFYADMLKVLGCQSYVVTIDINPKWSFDPSSKNIISLVGYSTNKDIVTQVADIVASKIVSADDKIIVALDSDHSKENVIEELNLYSKFVSTGSYLVVEDTNVNGNPSFKSHGPGPFEAVEEFLTTNDEFVIDRSRERHLLTFNPRGYLKRTDDSPKA